MLSIPPAHVLRCPPASCISSFLSSSAPILYSNVRTGAVAIVSSLAAVSPSLLLVQQRCSIKGPKKEGSLTPSLSTYAVISCINCSSRAPSTCETRLSHVAWPCVSKVVNCHDHQRTASPAFSYSPDSRLLTKPSSPLNRRFPSTTCVLIRDHRGALGSALSSLSVCRKLKWQLRHHIP